MRGTAYSASEAARVLGISIPTLKKMCASGAIPSFRTPGGHLRIPADTLGYVEETKDKPERQLASAAAFKDQKRARLHSEAKGSRMERQPERSRSDYTFETLESNQEMARLDRVHSDAFRRRWLQKATAMLPSWLKYDEQTEVVAKLDSTICRCDLEDEQKMPQILKDTIARVVSPFEVERGITKKRESIQENALWRLSARATEIERARAAGAIRNALSSLHPSASDFELRAHAEEAVRIANEGINKRISEEIARAEKEWQAKEAQFRKDREEQARATDDWLRKQRKNRLVQDGANKVFSHLLHLKTEGDISEEEYEDIDQWSLKSAVGKILENSVSGNESDKDMEKLVREIVAEELELT
jgi:excisionase family DNA binding protein